VAKGVSQLVAEGDRKKLVEWGMKIVQQLIGSR
jgi:hypothetical protein